MFRSKVFLLLAIILVSLFQVACSVIKQKLLQTAPVVEYQPPLVPVEFLISPSGIEFAIKPSFVTPLGRIAIGAEVPVYAFEEDDLIIVLRNQSTNTDDVYHIQDGRRMDILLDGEIPVSIDHNMVIIDITNARSVRMNPKGTVARMAAVDTSQDGYGCEGSWEARLRPGDRARVAIFQVWVRQQPGTSAPAVDEKYLAGGREVIIIDGPVCKERMRWWQVDSGEITLDNGQRARIVGWIPEESGDDWMLEPAN